MATSSVHVKRLFVNCHGIAPSDFDFDRPSWDDIKWAIRSLDGDNRDQAILIVDEGHNLLIGGGRDGVFYCETELAHGRFVLTDPSRPKDKTVTIMNGQPGDYVENHTVDLNAILNAAEWFFYDADTFKSLAWERI